MKRIQYITLLTLGLLSVVIGCKDESLSPYIEPLGAAHGLIQFVSAADGSITPTLSTFYDQSQVDRASFFDEGKATSAQEINAKFTWFSIDNRETISSIEFYLEYNENYSDDDRNPLIAAHGGSSPKPSVPAGKLFKTVTAPANGVSFDLKVTAAEIYELFKNNTYNYGSGPKNIFSAHPYNADFNRTDATHRFYGDRTYTVPGKGDIDLVADEFRVNWRLIAADGTAYGSWSPSVCAELVGANCTGQWKVNSGVYNPNATLAARNKVPIKSGVTEIVDITFSNTIATPPVLSLSPNQGTVVLAPVAGSTTKFTATYTANGYTGTVSLRVRGAVSGGSGPTAGLVQNNAAITLTVDNTAPQSSSVANGSDNVGRGLSNVITVRFNEAMSSKSADALKISITGQRGLDDVAAANMTLAADGLSATYLYLWKDSTTPFDNTAGDVTYVISGGKDRADNAFGGVSGTFRNDVGDTKLAQAVWIQNPTTLAFSSTTADISGVASTPTIAFVEDLGTQLKWTITQPGPGSTSGTWFWTALAWVDTDAVPDGILNQPKVPGQFTKDVAGLANRTFNGFYTGSAAISPFTVAASGSSTSRGTLFTPFTANGKFDVFVYFVSSTGNVSAISAPMTIQMN
jgi:hypothetical protein